jgi:hypothetical protein
VPWTHTWPTLAGELDEAHARAVVAATAGLADPALGPLRLSGAGVAELADAAVSSATPFVRAPLISRLQAVRVLHPGPRDGPAACPSCGVPTPCPTAVALFGGS